MTFVASKTPKTFPTQSLLLKDPTEFYRQGLAVATKNLEHFENFVFASAIQQFDECVEYLNCMDLGSEKYIAYSEKIAREKDHVSYLRQRRVQLRDSRAWWENRFLVALAAPRLEQEDRDAKRRCVERDASMFGDQTIADLFLEKFYAPSQYRRPMDNPELSHLRTMKFRKLLNDQDRKTIDESTGVF